MSLYGIGSYSGLSGAQQISSAQFAGKRRFQNTLAETRPSGDTVSISDEARRRLEEEAIKLGAGRDENAQAGAATERSESSSPQSTRQEMMSKIEKQIERLEQRLESVANSGMSDEQKESITGQIQEQISQLRSQLEAMAAEQTKRQVGSLSF